MTTPASPSTSLSRRALFGLGGSTLLLGATAAAWRWRLFGRPAVPTAHHEAPIPYADHDGWMVSVAEKQALRAMPPAGGTPPPSDR